jgi:hypothetical protein
MRASTYAEDIELKQASFCERCRGVVARGGMAVVSSSRRSVDA